MKKALVIKDADFSAVSVKQIGVNGVWLFNCSEGDMEAPVSTTWWYLDGTSRDAIRGKVIKKLKINVSAAGTIEIRKVTFANSSTHIVSSSSVITTLPLTVGINEYEVNDISIGNNESIGFMNISSKFRFYQHQSGQPFSSDNQTDDEVQFPDMNLNIGIFAVSL